MDQIRIRNLRSLIDTDSIKLCPLTVLVGSNSSGKSSFLRAFPLLRQSVETPTTSGILWFGRYVDYGTFDEAVRRGAEPQEIVFEFSIKLPANYPRRRPYYYPHWNYTRILTPLRATLAISLAKTSQDAKTFIRRISLLLDDDSIILSAKEDGGISEFRINAFDATNDLQEYYLTAGDNLVPELILKKDPQAGAAPLARGEARPLFARLLSLTSSLFDPRMQRERRAEIIGLFGVGTPDAMLNHMRNIQGGAGWQRRIATLQQNSETFRKLRDCVIANAFPSLLRRLGLLITRFVEPIRYIAPVRATAERYYRNQDLAVNEVDPQGKNLAMFLQSLTTGERTEFAHWSEEQLGFSVRAQYDGAHISLLVKDKNSNVEYNMTDMGFGFSQILPILAQVWSASQSSKTHRDLQRNRFEDYDTPVTRLLVIEQPELHLHPSFQAKVADMFVATIEAGKTSNMPMQVIFETHSETIINRLGHLVATQKLPREDVQIVFFEKRSTEADTTVSIATYSEDGVLQNWPFGFFLAGTEDIYSTKGEEAATGC